MTNFALIGASGFVAPRHLQAVKDLGGALVAAVDPNDSAGVLDRYFPDVRFFTEIERFDRFLEKLRRRGDDERTHYVSICSPNYLHDAHARLALRLHCDVICEKPLVISPWNLDQLADLEKEHGKRIYTVLQLRLHPALIALKERLDAERPRRRAKIELSYVTRRGPWYHVSWKGDLEKSGGVGMNIGIHFFDVLLWLFGDVRRTELHLSDPERMSGYLELEHADVVWYLSISARDLELTGAKSGPAYRALLMDGQEVDFSEGFGNLHTMVYRDILAGGGFGIDDSRPSIELVHRIRQSSLTERPELRHPLLLQSSPS